MSHRGVIAPLHHWTKLRPLSRTTSTLNSPLPLYIPPEAQNLCNVSTHERDMTTQNPYRYTALPDSKTHIRILTIDLECSRLSCALEIRPILDAPPFEALSYAWGDQGPASSILCEGANLAVTPYLLEGVQQIYAIARGHLA